MGVGGWGLGSEKGGKGERVGEKGEIYSFVILTSLGMA
jgi:hypothetical protein